MSAGASALFRLPLRSVRRPGSDRLAAAVTRTTTHDLRPRGRWPYHPVNSPGVPSSLSVCTARLVAAYGFAAPPAPFYPIVPGNEARARRLAGTGSWGLPSRAAALAPRPKADRFEGDPLTELRLLQSLTTRRRPRRCCCSIRGASPEVCRPFSTCRPGRSTSPRACQARVRSGSRVSHPPAGLLPSVPSGLVSCPWRSWGCPLQSFSLRAKP